MDFFGGLAYIRDVPLRVDCVVNVLGVRILGVLGDRSSGTVTASARFEKALEGT